MIFSTQNIIELLSENFNFEVIKDDIFKQAILLSSEEAFEFSLITGANYLITPIGYSVKGRMEVAIHRSVFQNGGFIYTPGLFSRDKNGSLKAGDSVIEQYKKYPQIFQGFKKLVVVDVIDNSCIEETLYKKIKNAGKDPSEYLVYKLFKNGSNSEPLLEYFASKLFNESGYMTENQAPWFNQNYHYMGKKINGGIPDFSAFLPDDISVASGSLNFDHMNIQTTSAIFLKEKHGRKRDSKKHLVLGEAKVTRGQLSAAVTQLDKYSATKLPGELYLIIPDLYENSVEEYGVLFVDSNRQIRVKPSPIDRIDPVSQKTDSKWLSNITKMYLLSNLNFEEILSFIRNKLALPDHQTVTSKELVISVHKTPMEEVIEYVIDRIQFMEVW